MLGWKPKSSDLAVASVRYRCMIPLRELQTSSFPVELFDPGKADTYEGVIFSKCYDAADHRLAKDLRSRGNAVILDLCDNHFYNPYGVPAYEAARKNLLEMIGLSDMVVCSTPTLGDMVAAEAGLDQRPEIVGDPIEFLDMKPASTGGWREVVHTFGRDYRVLWFGVHGSPNAPCGMADISKLADVFKELESDRGCSIELVVCSNSRSEYDRLVSPVGIRSSYIEYRREDFPGLLSRMDGVVLPVNKNPFTLAKSHNRLTTALFAGVPVVADSLPSYQEFSSFCTLDDWGGGLREVLLSPRVARQKALAGREYILKHWTPAHVAERWREVLSPLLFGRSTPSGRVRQ